VDIAPEEFIVNLPEYPDIRIRKTQDGKQQVLDILRHRFVKLTPEEWVRQHFVNYLVTEKGYPAALMANEVEIKVGQKRLRCDSVLFGSDLKPRMVIEYKAESVPITDKVLRQVATYNMLLHVRYLIVSNGDRHICLHYDDELQRWGFMTDIPHYSQL
jgi:predicted type IV restriction endonuclease